MGAGGGAARSRASGTFEELYLLVTDEQGKAPKVHFREGVKREGLKTGYGGRGKSVTARIKGHRSEGKRIKAGTFERKYTTVKPKEGELFKIARGHTVTVHNAESLYISIKGGRFSARGHSRASGTQKEDTSAVNNIKPWMNVPSGTDAVEYIAQVVELLARAERLVLEGYGDFKGLI